MAQLIDLAAGFAPFIYIAILLAVFFAPKAIRFADRSKGGMKAFLRNLYEAVTLTART